ncbi:hypothetical protein FSOLCH5_009574 [Fusarium solani]
MCRWMEKSPYPACALTLTTATNRQTKGAEKETLSAVSEKTGIVIRSSEKKQGLGRTSDRSLDRLSRGAEKSLQWGDFLSGFVGARDAGIASPDGNRTISFWAAGPMRCAAGGVGTIEQAPVTSNLRLHQHRISSSAP